MDEEIFTYSKKEPPQPRQLSNRKKNHNWSIRLESLMPHSDTQDM